MKKSEKSSKSPKSEKSEKSGKSSKSTKSKSLFNPMIALATFASLMRTSNANHFTRQATIQRSKKKRQFAEYKKSPKPYLEEAIKNMNSALKTNKPVQSGKKVLDKHPDIKSKSHPFHYGMPSENKHLYIAKREELLKNLSVAKQKRITNKLSRKNLDPSKRSKMNNKLKKLKLGSHRGL